MSRGPEAFRPLAGRVRVAAAFVAVLPLLSSVGTMAWAQAGPGAERYEVTITPPKKPGSEAAAEAAPVPEAASAEASQAPPDASAGAAARAADAASGDTAPMATPAAVPAPPTAAAKAAAPSPPRTLQVGAFRERPRADDLYERLRRSFDDVSVLEVQSGGQALYRVYVGRLPKGPALDDLRRRLSAAGFPSFDVPAPTVAAAD